MRKSTAWTKGFVPPPRPAPAPTRQAVQRQIAARLIGCDPALLTRLVLAGRLPTDSSGLIPIEAIERFAIRAISNQEIEMTIVNERMLAGIRYEQRKANGGEHEQAD
jgi:hypothetical protein